MTAPAAANRPIVYINQLNEIANIAPESVCDRLSPLAKAALAAGSLGGAFYFGYKFYDQMMLGRISDSVPYGIGFIGATLVSIYAISELAPQQPVNSAEPLPV